MKLNDAEIADEVINTLKNRAVEFVNNNIKNPTERDYLLYKSAFLLGYANGTDKFNELDKKNE